MEKKRTNSAHKIKQFITKRLYIAAYEQGCRNIGKTEKKDKIRVAFIVNYPETWNSIKSVYDGMVSQSGFDCTIIAVPKYNYKFDISDPEQKITKDAFTFFKERDYAVVDAFESSEWYDIESKYDYVFYTRPYNYEYPEAYRSYNVCRHAKVIYIPYAYSMLAGEMFYTILPEDFILTSDKVFLATESRLEECKREFTSYNRKTRNRFYYVGFPRFDLYKSVEKIEKKSFTVAWMPRWTNLDEKKNSKAGHFLPYYRSFLKFAGENPDVRIIIRPHPKMISNYLKHGVMSQDEVDAFTRECEQSGNVVLDTNKDYMNTVLESDVLVADYTSLIAEYFFTEKPILFCDNAEGLNREGQTICNALYRTDSFEAITEMIRQLKEGKDTTQSERREIIQGLLPCSGGNIGSRIIDIIKSDYFGGKE